MTDHEALAAEESEGRWCEIYGPFNDDVDAWQDITDPIWGDTA